MTRMAGQAADGVFQAVLFAAIAFNPERQASPLLMAASLAVLFGPYSLVGPLVGTLLDRWDRRLVLLWANVFRALLIVVTAGLLAASLPEPAVLGSALLVMGASRFVASGLSASLPHVTDRDSLVTVNAVFTTLGGFAAIAGLGLAAAVRAAVGGDDAGAAQTMLVGTALALIAAAIAAGFPVRSLGPDAARSPTAAGHRRRRALQLIAATPSVAVVFRAISAHRWAFGMNSLFLLVLANHAGVTTGLQRFLLLVGATAVGAVLAAVTTPVLAHRIGRPQTLATALAVAVAGQVLLLRFDPALSIGAATILGWAGQSVKLCGDVAMQTDIPDESRGEVFAVQDAVFNVAFIVGAAIAAITVPDDGKAVAVVLIGVVLYAAALADALVHRARQ
ncbi:hypothetical protein nbrc107697_02140 [Gordonia crocea]|uniref:MFS transporter n=2 Tax=Gordonia crocea TaxID=589162 RepID=A0A7M3SU51_9ACTN|nr:hypothetical protein nbrc107697_02140 [Gordonia crocea]